MSDVIIKAAGEGSSPEQSRAVATAGQQRCEAEPTWPDHRLTDLLRIEPPLVLAPMAGLGTVALAALRGDAAPTCDANNREPADTDQPADQRQLLLSYPDASRSCSRRGLA